MAQVQGIQFSSYNTMSALHVAVLQWCKTVCVCVCFTLSRSVCCWSYFSNGVGFIGSPAITCHHHAAALCESDCGCNGGVSVAGCCSFFTVVCYAN